MAQKNEISFQLQASEEEEVQKALDILNKVLVPRLKSIKVDDKNNHVKLGEKNLSFVTKSFEYASEHPELVPPYLSLNEMKIDLEAVKSLRLIHQSMQEITSLIGDSLFLSGSEAMDAALKFYESVRVSAQHNFSSSGAIYSDLSKRFDRPSKKKKIKTEEDTPV